MVEWDKCRGRFNLHSKIRNNPLRNPKYAATMIADMAAAAKSKNNDVSGFGF